MMAVLLPTEFADLERFSKIAVSDDVERGTATDSMSEQDKRNFIDTIWPRMDAINAYLDQHQDEAACNLGDIAQAAAELAVELNYWPESQ
jgi:hypothetical protein